MGNNYTTRQKQETFSELKERVGTIEAVCRYIIGRRTDAEVESLNSLEECSQKMMQARV